MSMEIADKVFRQFAHIYPHEAHALDPEKFWEFFKERAPGVGREEMEKILAETGEAS